MRGLGKNNKGYSLVELIIVVAIIAVVIAGASMSIILVLSANARTCANDIVSAISECKIMTMTKGQGNVRVIIYRDGENGTIYSELQTRETSGGGWVTGSSGREKIGASRCLVGTTSTTDDIPTSQSTAWAFYFDRSSGKLLKTGDTVTSVDKIHVVGGRKHYVISIAELTGKTTLKLQ